MQKLNGEATVELTFRNPGPDGSVFAGTPRLDNSKARVLGLIIPRTRYAQDCSASAVTGSAGDYEISVNLTSLTVQRPKERDCAIVSFDLESHSAPQDVAAR
jgi:hypothetical protein